ncbi:hypothetical protein UFOVP71_78 [uncultured Caudovirales phage]|uniref:Uncharacterized protein n=1 Tax=uncultured Caudovirales phage TaxID=2100421 RepID=A0A6J5TD42_9CAUD|nr:hypothetical protein UFOVP71_78 [uncultured Caudovirales phage]
MEDNQDSSFSFIRENCNESKMFRNNYLGQLTLRDAVDNVFLNMLTIYLLSHESESRPFAQDYAHRTLQFGNFNSPRVGGTDLYQGLHIMLHPDGETAGKLKAHEQNTALAEELRTNAKLVKDFLRGIASGTIDRTTAIRIMYRLEGQMDIDISNYKSLRRLISDWENLSIVQKKLCVTRLLQYYRLRGRHSELLPILDSMAERKDWEIPDVENAEAAAHTGGHSKNKFLSTVGRAAAGFGAGYALGKLI